MTDVFIKLLNMSITASWITLVVILLRFVLKKAPRSIVCALWAVVALRLILPFSLESVISLVPSTETVSPDIIYAAKPQIHTGISSLNSVVNPVIGEVFAPEPMTSANPLQIYTIIAANVWVLGITLMLLYTVFSYMRLHLKTREGVETEKGIWLCDRIDTPFILGVIRPRIFLPSSMKKEDMDYVISHEKAHLRRLDHIWKPVGFLLLTVYWFNPVMWLAYVLLCRDIELACDEKVILEFGSECKKPYSEALINCSVPRRAVSACPLAFGEVGVKGRIKNVLSYKKPAFWLIIAAVLLSVSLAVCFLTDPPKTTAQDIFNEDGYTVLSQEKYELTLAVEKAKLPEAIYTEKHDFEEGDVLAYSSQHTKIYLQSIQPANEGDDKLYFFFDCEYTLGDTGKMLYPYYKTGENASQGFGLASKTLRDNNTYYDNAVSVRGQGPGEQIVFYVDTEAVKAAEGALYINVYLYETEYAKGSHTKIKDDMYAVEYGEKQLTLDDVKELSKKGDALCSDDFEGYKYTETGSGIYICVYKIDDMFTLTVGYAGGNKPLYARLSANDGSGDEVDIRYFDVESYITLHKDNPLVENLSGRINVYSVGYSEEAEKRFTHLAGIPEKAYMDSIHYLPVKHIDSKTEFDQFISDIEEYFSFEKTLNGSEPFADCLQVYDKSFFAENDLCLIYTGRSTSNCGYSVSPFKSNKTITVSLREFPNEADAGSTDGWLVAVGIPKSDIRGVERICAVLNGDNVTEPEAQMIEMYKADTGDIFFDPYVALMNNGKFTMSFSALSSYIGAGEYFIQDDKLILVCDDYGYKYIFTKTDLKLIYDESESDGPANYSELKDGMVFHKCYEHIITDSEDYH